MIGPFPATLTAASLLGLLLVFLAYRCVAGRAMKMKAEAGKGENPADVAEAAIAHAMRVMGNFVEYVPMALILLLCLEAARVEAWLTYGIAGLLVLARVLHAWGFSRSKGTSAGRFWGTLLTWVVILIECLTGLYVVLIA